MSSVVDVAPRAKGSSSDYQALAQVLRSAGLLERRPGLYSVRMSLVALALSGGWAGLWLVRTSWAAIGVAVYLAVVLVQVTFVGHDVGHQQVFRSRRGNRRAGLVVGNLLTGLSYGWWVHKHNSHHAHPNQVGSDPDIGDGFIAFTSEIANKRSGPARWLARYQAWFILPLLVFEGVALQVASFRSAAHRRGRDAGVEVLLLTAHAIAYIGLVLWVLPPLHALAFVAVNQAVLGLYLGCSFAPNHKGMPIISEGSHESFLCHQVMTSRNVSGGRLATFLLGGLNYQIEHHLFPAMPRRNLVKSQRIVREFCVAHNLPYQQCSILSSYRQALSHLQRVGAADPG